MPNYFSIISKNQLILIVLGTGYPDKIWNKVIANFAISPKNCRHRHTTFRITAVKLR